MMRWILIWSLGPVAILGNAKAQTTLPPVRVVAPTTSGGSVICRGLSCEAIIEQFKIEAGFLQAEITLEPGQDVPISKSDFCKKMKAEQPAGCNYSSPPSTPGYDSSWVPNGCGTGPRQNWFLDKVLSQANSFTYSGNLNAPFAGVSFLASCNQHDLCWGMAMDRANCDLTFREAMVDACGVVSSTSGYNACVGYAGMYHGAVSTTNASADAYNAAAAAYQCAAWASDMKENGCSP